MPPWSVQTGSREVIIYILHIYSAFIVLLSQELYKEGSPAAGQQTPQKRYGSFILFPSHT